jgi:SulP family sulfate permease
MHLVSLIFGLSSLAVMLSVKRFAPKLPGVLIAVVLATTASYLIGFESMGGRIVGVVPQGLPGFSLPALDWKTSVDLLPMAFVIALVSFMEAMSSCKIIAIKTRTTWNENQELVGQGLAKIAASFNHTMPVSGSFSRSALNLAAGARTGLSSVFTVIVVSVTLLVLTPLLHHLPKPTLAAVIILAVISLLNFGVFREAWSASRQDGIAAATTFVATLLFAPNIQYGMMLGIMLSLAMFLFRTMKPRIVLLGLDEHGELQNADRFSLPRFHPKVAAIRFDGRLYFANVSYFEESILYLISNDSQISYVLVDARGINGLDASGVEMLRNLVTRLKENRITLVFYNIKLPVLEVMQRTGLHDDIEQKNIFLSERETLKDIKERLEAESAHRVDSA